MSLIVHVLCVTLVDLSFDDTHDKPDLRLTEDL